MNWRRKRLKVRWFLTTVFTLFVSATTIYKIECILNECQKTPTPMSYRLPKKSLLSVKFSVGNSTTENTKVETVSTAIRHTKHVTKSMAQLDKMDEVNKYFLFLNFVPKSGSEILVFLLEKIQGLNNFKHVRLKGGNKRKLNKIQQEELVDEIYGFRRNLAIPLSFDRTVYFVNFTSFDKQLPIYINLIRHPVEKVLSRAISKNTRALNEYFIDCIQRENNNCNFKNGQSYDLTIPYFCGHDPKCTLLNNQWAFDTAKQNVEKYYQVVGVLEELNTTLDVLEGQIPQFFKRATITYEQHLLDIYKHKKDPIVPENVRTILERTKEIDFYNWIKNRLFNQAKLRL